jgi:hypothetical protein
LAKTLKSLIDLGEDTIVAVVTDDTDGKNVLGIT